MAHCNLYVHICSLDGNNPLDGLELWEGKTDNEWSGQVKMQFAVEDSSIYDAITSGDLPCVLHLF